MFVSELIDRTLSEWLYPAGVNRPAFDLLHLGITSGDVTFVTKQRQAYSGDGGIVQIGSELILYQSAVTDTPAVGQTTVTVNERGYLESAAAAHLANDKVEHDPDFPRIHIFNALVGIIRDLYGWGVYRRSLISTIDYSARDAIVLPAGTKRIISVRPRASTSVARWRKPLVDGRDYDFFNDVNPPELQFYRGGAEGRDLRIVAARDFTVPTLETQDLSLLADPVPESLQEDLPMAVAGRLIMGKELSRIQIEEIRRAIASIGGQVPVGASINLGNALIDTFKKVHVQAELHRQTEDDPTTWQLVS